MATLPLKDHHRAVQGGKGLKTLQPITDHSKQSIHVGGYESYGSNSREFWLPCERNDTECVVVVLGKQCRMLLHVQVMKISS